jgi:2-keto-4-pentenoate hydratase/2-oxohepta-3-ene-1,7-dioic acid hydratase in catechol pathway
MRLATFTYKGKTRVGIVIGDQIIDTLQLTGMPETLVDFLSYDLINSEIIRNLPDTSIQRMPLAEVKLEAPILRPPKFFGIGLNYMDHIEETGQQQPETPTVFNKQSTCVIGPEAYIHKPGVSDKLDYEGELGFVIGKRCRHVPRDRASEVIAGYLVVNDVSVRDWQSRSHTWTLGKSFDTHGPTGPWIVTPDEIGDPHTLDIKTWLNDELRQSSNTRHLLFDCFYLVEYLSTVCTLEPGDIISTGTSSGVGFKMTPRGYMKPGDVVKIEIERIGTLINTVIEEPATTAFIG